MLTNNNNNNFPALSKTKDQKIDVKVYVLDVSGEKITLPVVAASTGLPGWDW